MKDDMNDTPLDTSDKDVEEKNKSGRKKKRDIGLKVLSVLTAIIIWFAVLGLESPISTRKFTSIPVEFENASTMKSQYNLSVIVESDVRIDVTVAGKKSYINKLKPSDVYAYIDLSGVSVAGELSLPIEIRTLDDTIIADQSQMNHLVYVDEMTSKTLTVQGYIKQSKTEAGVDLRILDLSPENITVTGPKGILTTLSHGQVDLYLGSEKIERSLTVTENISLINNDNEEVKNQYSKYLKLNQTTAEVYVSATRTKEIPLALDFKYGYYTKANTVITINPTSVYVKGSPDYLDNMSEIKLGSIDERKIEDDTTLKMEIVMPDGLENLSGDKSAEVEIKFIDSETNVLQFETSNFKVMSPPKFDYHIIEESVQLKLRGPVANLGYLKKSGISVSIDLSKITEKGTFVIPVDVVVLSDSKVFGVGEYSVNVEIY